MLQTVNEQLLQAQLNRLTASYKGQIAKLMAVFDRLSQEEGCSRRQTLLSSMHQSNSFIDEQGTKLVIEKYKRSCTFRTFRLKFQS